MLTHAMEYLQNDFDNSQDESTTKILKKYKFDEHQPAPTFPMILRSLDRFGNV